MPEKQNDQSGIDRQYLKAMGIDLWVDRDSSFDAAAVVGSSVSGSAAESRAAPLNSDPDKQTHLSVSKLAADVENWRVSCSEPAKPAELLLITEELNLTGECRKLLGSMFDAIGLDSSMWLHAGVSVADDAIAVSQLEASVNPKATIMLINAGGDPTSLQSVRGVRHEVPSLKGFVVVSFHPQDLLDNPELKRPAWEDLKQLRQWLTQA